MRKGIVAGLIGVAVLIGGWPSVAVGVEPIASQRCLLIEDSFRKPYSEGRFAKVLPRMNRQLFRAGCLLDGVRKLGDRLPQRSPECKAYSRKLSRYLRSVESASKYRRQVKEERGLEREVVRLRRYADTVLPAEAEEAERVGDTARLDEIATEIYETKRVLIPLAEREVFKAMGEFEQGIEKFSRGALITEFNVQACIRMPLKPESGPINTVLFKNDRWLDKLRGRLISSVNRTYREYYR